MKKVLIFSLSAIAFLILQIYEYYAKFGICDEYEIFLCNFYMSDISRITNFFGILSVLTFILLVTKEKCFQKWWRFAWWGGPLTIGVIMLVNAGFHHTAGGFMNLSDMFDDDLTLLAYIFFSVGSIVQIWRGYKSK